MSTSLGIIKKFVDTLVKTKKQGTEAADEAFKAVGAVNYRTFKSKFRAAQSGYSSQNFLEQKCGIRINNKDTGAITGSDAGYSSTAKTSESIVPETAFAKNLTAAEYNSFTKNGLTVNITYNEINYSDDDDDDYAYEILKNFDYNTDTYLEKQKLVTRALYNWWLPESLDLINQSLGVNFTDGRANINELNIKFVDDFDEDEDYALNLNFDYDLGYASNITLEINANLLYKITADDKNGTLPGNYIIGSGSSWSSENALNYLDRLILEAMTEITLKANVAYVEKLPEPVRGGLYAIVGGYDDASKNYGFFINEDDDEDNTETVGYTYFRYLAKNYADGEPDAYDGGDTMPTGLSYNSAKTVLTATTKFTGAAIDLSNFASTVKTVNASKLTKAVKITGNDNNNSIIGGSGADTLDGSAGNDTLTGGKGNDLFIYSGGNDLITDYASGDKISLGAAVSKSAVSGSNVVLTVGSGKLTIKGGKGKSLGMIDSAGNSFSTIVGSSSGGSTTLTVTDKTTSPVTIAASVKTVNASKRTKAVKITGNKLANSIAGGSKNDSLYGGDGNDTILGNAGNDKLYGQAGNDYLSGGKGNDSIAGGAGNNTLTGGAGNDIFFYGGGNDLITDYAEGDKIKIASGFVSSINPSGNDVVFTVGKGKITVTGAADKTITYIDANGEQDYSDSATSEFNIKGSTIKLMPTYLNETFNIADYGATLQNVDASAVLLDIEITGNALRNSILGGENNETLIGGKGNDTLTGGTGSDVFLYNNGDGNDVITDYSEEDFIQFTTGTAKVKRSGKDVVFTLGKGTITVTGGASKIITYADAKGEHSYPEVVDINSAGTKITLLENYIKDTFDVGDYDDGIKTIDASAVAHDLEITGNKLMNSIKGGEGNDTLWGDKGNDTLTGGNGSDVFVYSNGDGNDLITDYNEEDKIKIASGKVSVKKNGKDVIFTVGSGKITVAGAASKTVTYIDANDKTNYFPTTPAESIIWKDSNTTAILRETYSKTTFTAADYNASIKKIDASAVTHNIKITGNGKANQILGGYENDTIIGGKGNDTLQGGSGADVFVYSNGDGKDIILDYAEEDTVQIKSGTAKVSVSGSDVVFTVGSGKITLLGAANKIVSYVEGGKTKTYVNSANNILEDDNFITDNDLSSLVQSKVIDCSFAEFETPLTAAKALMKLAHSSKK